MLKILAKNKNKRWPKTTTYHQKKIVMLTKYRQLCNKKKLATLLSKQPKPKAMHFTAHRIPARKKRVQFPVRNQTVQERTVQIPVPIPARKRVQERTVQIPVRIPARKKRAQFPVQKETVQERTIQIPVRIPARKKRVQIPTRALTMTPDTMMNNQPLTARSEICKMGKPDH